MTPAIEAKLEAYFEKLDELSAKVEELVDAKKWHASVLQSELGHKTYPDSADVEGNIHRQYRKLSAELRKEFKEAISTINKTLHGTDVAYGVSTKTNIMWKGHFPLWSTITAGFAGIIFYFVAKVAG